ncbi:hypothetical protein [Mycobacterium talmoniae]|uniref:Uncharacterized protein n=1 Tax=Mycobacterium talmoniae TaxID=1858794 RepID=A0A1S1NNS7_9MYCO|nr:MULTISPECIES: hypothetical protein [Mycobacterium]OHV05800.1 hypothetical protein BKN37_04335 [Mycobacterium talmoniae]PQM44358.1 hypothetical protein C1Y40_05483 [Mycobacterium talmoniae]TDH57672.1 hypothetical protein E2F47_00330 [Mycobacterium eburneum]
MTTREARVGLGRSFFGPPRPRTETLLAVAGSVIVTALLAGYVWQLGGWRDRSALQIAVLAVIIVDLIAGIFTTSSPTANRWYHRANARRFRLGFVLVHTSYFVVPALVFGTGWVWAIANSGLLLGAAAVIESAPIEHKRTVAVGAALTAALIGLIWLPLPAALGWLPVLLFVKVLVCFLVPADGRP